MKRLIEIMNDLNWMPEAARLEWYPPFRFMGVKVVRVSPDYRLIHVYLPQRWYGVNMHGTIFGGFLAATADPLPALLCGRLFPGTQVWTKKLAIEFLKPSKGRLDLLVHISEEDLQVMQAGLAARNSVAHEFTHCFRDSRGREVARIWNTVFIRRRRSALPAEETPQISADK